MSVFRLDTIIIIPSQSSAPFTEYSVQVVASTIIGEGKELSPSGIFSTEQDGDFYHIIRFSIKLLFVRTSLIVSTPPRNVIAEYASMETTSSTALQLTWDHPLCDYGVRTGYTVCTLLTLRG